MSDKVIFENVNLHYSSLAYKARSLKEYFFHKIKGKASTDIVDIHALKDISFRVKNGERIGLMGHNGAGKSTLLKAIAGLYPPSSGKVHVQGSIRALFELSLGFESEATGRENISYRGLLLGKTPLEMKKMEEDIIQFADLGEFIDYPIKTYSAGMTVRLAFAISTLITGNILLLDEVIAAGDASFLKKAKTRILELIHSSEILFFASHNLEDLQELCTRCFVLENGKIQFDGSPSEAIAYYRNSLLV